MIKNYIYEYCGRNNAWFGAKTVPANDGFDYVISKKF